MEKQAKSMLLGGKKRQRKISMPGSASEPKQIKLDPSDKVLSSEKKNKRAKPKKGGIQNLPEAATKTKPTPTLTAKPIEATAKMGKKKHKIESKNALTKTTNASNGNITSVMETTKADLESLDGKIESVQPNDEAATSKKQKKPNANNNQNSLNAKPKSVLTALPKKKKRKSKLKEPKSTDLKKETEVSDNVDDEEPLENTNEDAQDTEINTDEIAPVPVTNTNKNAQSIEDVSLEEIREKFPILKDSELKEKFLKVPLNNNQKGRIRQAIKLSMQGTSTTMFPDIINGKIQAILNSSVDLTDSDLRRVRILFNMLKTAVESPSELEKLKTPKKKADKKKNSEKGDDDDDEKKEKKEGVKKVKGPKRYVVFLGNLPLNVDKDEIMNHFKELNEHIKDIRLPKVAEGKKSAFAYVEISNEPSFELALSKHHSMMGSKRIKVLYTTQQNSKISKSEAKGKSAKLIALQKSGKLVGSIPANKKRSHRRTIMKNAKAKEEQEKA